MHANVTPELVRHAWDGRGRTLSSFKHTQCRIAWQNKKREKWHLTETTGKGNGVVKKNLKKKTKHKNSEAPQAGLIASNWQRWVRQLGFSNGSLCHSFFFPHFPVRLSFDCMDLCVWWFTLEQEVFGSSVVSCPECFRESSSDGQPVSPLSAAGLCRKNK